MVTSLTAEQSDAIRSRVLGIQGPLTAADVEVERRDEAAAEYVQVGVRIDADRANPQDFHAFGLKVRAEVSQVLGPVDFQVSYLPLRDEQSAVEEALDPDEQIVMDAQGDD